MINTDAVRGQVRRMLARFPSETAEIRRPKQSDYGENTGETEKLLTVKVWWSQMNQPSTVKAVERGTTFKEDDRKWVCALWEKPLEAVKRGDMAVIGGKTYRICNSEARLKVRVFWQLEEVSA